MVFKIKAPNPLYSGITEGVPFVKGLGETDDQVIRNILVNDYKYEDISEDAPKVEAEKSLDEMTVPELKKKAKEMNLTGYSKLNQEELIALIKGEPPVNPDDNDGVNPGNLEEDNNDLNGNPPANNEGQ